MNSTTWWIGGARRRRVAAVAVALAGVGAALVSSSAPVEAAPGPTPSFEIEPREVDRHPRLAASLEDDLERSTPGPGEATAARRSGAAPVTVVVEASDGRRATAAIEAAGGTVTDRAAELIQADVPAVALGGLSQAPGVRYVREPYLATTDVVSAGVGESGAAAFQGAGEDGAGVKVAVIDIGFSNFTTAQAAGELGAAVATDLSRCNGFGTTEHGTAVAEIVHDMAPAAELLLVCAETDVEFASALATMAGQGVDVVNGSIGFALGGRGDGLDGGSSAGAAVAQLRRQGILYVASAGNYGTQHYDTAAAGDSDGQGLDDFVNITADKELQFVVAPSSVVAVAVKWDSWQGIAPDFDVYAGSDACPDTVFASEEPQSDGAPPLEFLFVQNCSSQAQTFGVIVNRYAGSGSPRMDFFFDGGILALEATTPGGIPEPATSAAVMAVGAHCVQGGAAEPYSSRGPTIDGRTKPDISGPDAVATSAVPLGAACASGFQGTSASAPHVAGAAALLLGANPNLDVAELQQILEDRALDSGAPGADNVFGAGRLRLGTGGPSAPTPQPLTAVAPVRLFDSRPGTVGAAEGGFGAGGRTTPLGAGADLAIPVRGVAGVPNDATAVVLNVTVTGPTAQGWITVHPGTTVPLASNLNFVPGQTVAVHVTATVGTDGKVRFFNSHGATDLVVDLAGWYGPSGGGNGRFTSLSAPVRAFDSRDIGSGYAEGAFGSSGRVTPLGSGEIVDLPLAGAGGVPVDATAVVANVTATGPTADAWFTVYPTGGAVPLASSLNFRPGQTVANLVVMPLGSGGRVAIANARGATHAVVDVVGYYRAGTGAGYVALDPPTRDLDTRSGNGRRSGLGPGGTFALEVARYYGVPARATAVLLSLTAVSPTQGGWFTVYPGGAPAPLASNLNFEAGQVVPNAVIAGVGANGTVVIQNARGTTQVVSDLAGYFVG